MYSKRLLLSIFIIVIYYSPVHLAAQESDNPCVGLKTCAICTQNPECAWCSQSDFHGQDKKPLPRCDTKANHENHLFKCNKNQLFSHVNEMIVDRSDNLNSANSLHIQPQELSLKLRVDDPVEFNMKYKEVEDYPLELYYLMDGTYSMKDDKDVLESLGDAIGERIRTLTSKYSQGFGTFVDKVTMPFASRVPEIFQNPCLTEGDTCIPPYGFKNHMPLSNNTKEFSNAVKAFQLSASSDFAEGGLDALMQVMVCEREIGWSTNARRLIIYATDATFHYAGDGRLGGIILPNDGKCHMDKNGEYYTHSVINDYPSMAQINAKAKEHSVNIIFAVTSEVTEDYEILARVIEGSNSTELAKNSSNIVDLVEQQYKKITSKVDIQDTFPAEYFKVTYYSACHSGGAEKETNTCDSLKAGIMIQFRVKIQLKKCPPTKEEWKKQYKIYAVGLAAGVLLNVETLCDCPCENTNGIPNSYICNRKGTEICGLCQCNPEHFGEFCECSSSNSPIEDDSKACRKENSSETCSGRGNCICRQCVCTEKRYSGPYCECDNENCNRVEGKLCAGHGICDCGKCVCSSGWNGTGCECSTERASCYQPESDQECSGHGTCVCGQCKCTSGYGGRYCSQCRADSCKRCDELKHCVQCKLFGTGTLNPAECELSCYEHSITPVDVISGPTSSESDEIICKAEDFTDQCVFIFSYKSNSRNKLQIKAQRTKECPPEPPIFWIITIGSSLVVLIGLILFCAFRIYRTVQIKREYAAYKKEKDNVVWTEEINPLYNDPIRQFKNPTYAGKD